MSSNTLVNQEMAVAPIVSLEISRNSTWPLLLGGMECQILSLVSWNPYFLACLVLGDLCEAFLLAAMGSEAQFVCNLEEFCALVSCYWIHQTPHGWGRDTSLSMWRT